MKKFLQISFLFITLGMANLVFAESVDINTADAKTIASNIKGVGLVKATAIVNYREKNGPFKSVDELTQIKGIGPKIIQQNQQNLVIVQQEQ